MSYFYIEHTMSVLFQDDMIILALAWVDMGNNTIKCKLVIANNTSQTID